MAKRDKGHQASYDFWVWKLQSTPRADNPRYATAAVCPYGPKK